MNPNNPLLNRLYEKKTSKSKRPPAVIKDEISHNRDKVLIPKFASKNLIQQPPTSVAQRQKTALIRPNLAKLPPLTQKQIGRERVMNSEKKTTFRQRKVSFNSALDLPVFPTELSFSTPQHEQKFEEQFEIQRKESSKKLKTVSSLPVIQKDEEQLFQYLKILEKNEELKDQFCYMNRGQRPYSYQIVDYQNVNKDQFLTVSLRGVSIYKDGESEFTTADKLYREIEVYRKVKKIQFFQQYLLCKIIKHWRYRSVKKKFESQCKLMMKILLSQNQILQKYHHFLFNIKEDFCKCKFMDIRISTTAGLEQLQYHLRQKQNIIEKSLDYFENSIQKSLKQTIQRNLNRFRKQERVNLTSDGKQIGQQGFLPYDTKKKSMKYTQIAKLKQFQGSMYRLLKMTDLVRVNIKSEMIKDGLHNFAFELKGLHDKYLSRKQSSFVSWVNMQIIINKPKGSQSFFVCTPTIEQLQQTLENHLKSILQKFYKKHYLLIEKKDQFFCESFEPQVQEFPIKLDFKYFIQGNKQCVQLKEECNQQLRVCINDIKVHLNNAQKLLKIYDDSFFSKNVNSYMENQALKSYLISQSENRQVLTQFQQITQFGLVYLDMRQALTLTKQKFDQKFRYISNAIPTQLSKRCENLAQKIKSLYNQFKQNPSTVLQFITFMKKYQSQKPEVVQQQKKIEQILQLEEMVYKNGLRIGENSKMFIHQSTTYYKQLQRRFQEIQSNQEKERKKFNKMVDDMVDPLDAKADQLYNKIYEDQLISNSESDIDKCMERLAGYQHEFNKLKDKKQELFYYQAELKLGHKDLPNYFKLETSLDWILKIWRGRQKYNQFLNHIKTRGYAEKTNLNIGDLKQFVKDIELATSQIEYVELLQNFKQDALNVLSILQICRLVSADTLQQEHKNTIREKLVTNNKRIKDYLFTIEGGRSIICNNFVSQTNIMEIRHQLQEVVHASAQESIIKKNIQEIQEFWKKSRIIIINQDIAKNGVEIPHLGLLENEKLQQKIGSYLITFKNILGSKHSVGQLQARVTQQIQTCQYLEKLIQKWAQVQKQWIKLLPLMTNCPSIKHQSNVYFEFTSLDNSIRKHNRQINDLLSIKKIAEDYSQKRYLSLMEHIQGNLREVNKIFASFLEIKRNTYHRFFFLADQELISILQNTKDAKSLAKYAGYCFNCDRLLLDKELVSGFETSTQVFKLRKVALRGEPDQMFKSVEENMKTSLKFSILALIPKMKVGMNIQQQHQNSLQAVLVADRFLWTQMTELYLNPTSYQSYQLFLRRPCQQLAKHIRKTDITPQHRHKLSSRLVQAMSLRESGQQLIKQQSTKQDFSYKQHNRYSIQQQQIYITHLNYKIKYGLQYYPPSKITIPTQNYKMLLTQVFITNLCQKVLIVTGVEGDGKRNLMVSCAREYGYYYRELVCNKNISVQYVVRFVQGALLAGAWLSFYQFEHLQPKVLVKLLNQIQKVIKKLKKSQEQPQQDLQSSHHPNHTPTLKLPSPQSFPLSTTSQQQPQQSQRSLIKTSNGVMFNFITHGFYPQRVSVYQFDNFALSEPNHKKICQWLLQVNNFTQWQQLSSRLVAFLETIFPFLQRVMGSFMSILRKVIDTAVMKKRNYSHRHKETDILAETFKQQILQKSDQNIHHILNQALHTYFYYEIPQQFNPTSSTHKSHKLRRKSLSIDSKLSVLCSLLQKKTPNILVIGPRTNKSRLIKQSGQALKREIFTIYPQATDYFFHSQAIQKLNKIDERHIIHYDGQSIMREWNDLVISGYLLMEGKKIRLNNQVVIELRDVGHCSPSFVGSCQIVYIGHVLTKKERFVQLAEAGACQLIMEPMGQIFGENFQNLPQYLVQRFAQFLKPYAKDPRSKNFHKLIVWFGNVIGIEGLWNRFYAGRYTDVTVNKFSQQLVPIDQTKYLPIEQRSFLSDSVTRSTFTMGNLLVHTKNTILYYQLFKNLTLNSIPVLLTGKFDTGKSTFIKLLINSLKNLGPSLSKSPSLPQTPTQFPSQSQFPSEPPKNQLPEQKISQTQTSTQISKINLPIILHTNDWTKILKSSLNNIRRDGKNYLLNIGDNDIIIAVDDLDLGYEMHREFLRQIIDIKVVQDSRFEDYTIAKAKIIAAWHKQSKQPHPNSYKLFDRTLQLYLSEPTRQSIATIIRANTDHFTKKNNMSKEVVSVIDTYLVKALLITFDDIANISGQNTASSIVLAALRNFLALPRKNVLMSAQNYVGYFKAQLKVRMMQKCFTAKSAWQYNNVFENINKVIFYNLQKPTQSIPQSQTPQQQSMLLFQQSQFKPTTLSKLKQKLCSLFPHLYIFDEMLKIIILLNNQLHLIDSNCILVGRSGTGKITILKVIAEINKMYVYDNKYDVSQCIVRCLKGDMVILLQSFLRRDFGKFMDGGRTLYRRIGDCSTDADLEKLVTDENMKKQYNALISQIPNRQGPDNDTKIIRRVLSKLKSVIVFDTFAKYKEATNKFRELNRYFVCYLDEWPAQALLNISGINVSKTQIQQLSPVRQKSTSSSPQKQKQIITQPNQELDLPKLLAQVFTYTNRSMISYDEPSISIKKFQFFLTIFEEMYRHRNNELTEKIQFYTKIYSKFYEACNLIAEWEKRVDFLRVQLEEQIKRLDKELGINQLQSMTFSLLHKKKEEEEKKVLEKNEEMASIKRQMQRQLQGLKKMMENISKIVGSMQRAEMSELKKIYKSSQIVSFGLECLCILLGEEPTQKSINKILADPNLMMKMKSNHLLQNKNARVVEKMKLEESKIKDQYESKGKFEASRVLIDWIKSVLQYWTVLQDHQKLSTSYKAHKKQYSQSLQAQSQIQSSLQSLKSQLLTLNKTHTQLFTQKQENTAQYSKINTKIHNAKLLLPALQKSETQTWQVIKELRNNMDCLIGNCILAVVCLIYLPLKRLTVKKGVIADIKKLLNIRSVMFDVGFMGVITGVQDALVEDLNLVAIKELGDYPVLIVDPERRAIAYLFEHDPHLATSITTNTFTDMSNSLDIAAEIQKHKTEIDKIVNKRENTEGEEKKEQTIPMQQSQHLNMQQIINVDLEKKYVRKTPIFHTTDQNYKSILQKLPDNTFIVDWKFTTIDTNQKIFLRIASKKKPEYFTAKKQLNSRIKQNLHKIQSYKHKIYQTITQKQIKILDDHQFVQLGSNLLSLQLQTQKQKQEYKNKLNEIQQYSKQINQEVNKIIFMINSLKKIKNVALDIVLDVGCSGEDIVGNVVKWAVGVVGVRERVGWMLAVVLEFCGEGNEELVAILARDAVLKASQVLRTKKPINISNKNYDNLCKIGGYTPNLKIFTDNVLRYAKQFEIWTLDSFALEIPSLFKPQLLSILQQLCILKLFKPKLLYPSLQKHLQKTLQIKSLTGYTNSQLLSKTSRKYPIIAHCSIQHLQSLCAQLNNSKMCIKSLVQINDTLELKRFIWGQMSEGNWVVLHSVYDRASREMLQDIVEYVVNYEEQECFRVFVYVDQVELGGYENLYQITTKYNNVSGQASNSKKSLKTQQRMLLEQSKYIENIGISLYEEMPSFKEAVLEAINILEIELPTVTVETAQMNPSASSFIIPQTPTTKPTTSQKPSTPMVVSNLMPGLLSLSLPTSDKQRIYFQKLVTYICISQIASWIKYPKLRLSKLQPKLLHFAKYIKQYSIPMEFNLYNIAAYVGRIYCSSLGPVDRLDVMELVDRIFDQSKISQKSLFGIPTHKQSLALAFAGIGRGGIQISKDWVDEKVRNNYQLLGCQQSYITQKHAQIVENAFNTLALIKYSNRPVKQQASQIRSALARLPTSPLVFSRQVKNTLFLHAYMNQLKHHNNKIAMGRQFLDWVNISSNQQYKEDEISSTRQNNQNEASSADIKNTVSDGNGNAVDMFTWSNLLSKVRDLTGYDVPQFKVKAVLINWLNNLKRKHQFLLYWNLDNPVLVLHPVLLVNFPMVVSTYIISYLSSNYSRIKLQGQSINKSILYTLQLQFSRQTDQKQLYMTQGILLPDLLYKQFRYNFQLKMLDGLQQWNGQQNAPLVMLKMKKIPELNSNQSGRDKDSQDYRSPDIQIGTRVYNRVEIVYRIQTYIDGNFQEWGLRRPMLISQ